MQHKADIGLVNAHAKSDGGHNNGATVLAEGLLGGMALGIGQSGVVRQGLKALPV